MTISLVKVSLPTKNERVLKTVALSAASISILLLTIIDNLIRVEAAFLINDYFVE